MENITRDKVVRSKVISQGLFFRLDSLRGASKLIFVREMVSQASTSYLAPLRMIMPTYRAAERMFYGLLHRTHSCQAVT